MTVTHAPGGAGIDHRTHFRHEALFYGGAHSFVEDVCPFVDAAVVAGDPIMVALVPEKLEILRQHLGPSARRVEFVDMSELGRNPGRIIPAWRRFLDRHPASTTLRGLSEPIWPARRAEETAECERHEGLLNVAFGADRPWWLRCIYDVTTLSASVVDHARLSHPLVCCHGQPQWSRLYQDGAGTFDQPLVGPPADVVVVDMAFDASSLRSVRGAVSGWASATLTAAEASDLVLAVHEVAANSVLHGGGVGRLRYWREGGRAVVEVSDSGCIERPLVGCEAPPLDHEMGRGLWLANQLCDLVELRSSADGTVIRLHVGH